MPDASIHPPLASRIDNPGTRFGDGKVVNPGSACGTRLASVSSAPSTRYYSGVASRLGTAKLSSRISLSRNVNPPLPAARRSR
jgi:hypothetical protein